MPRGNKILVTPEELQSTSQRFADKGNRIQQLTRQMLELVNAVGVTWQGEAYQAFNKQFHSLEGPMNKMFRKIQEHNRDLQQMARNYQTAERNNMQRSHSLPRDVV
ncbi:MAG: WXG100 family type VII secretion target [Lachnospiraceae bacterium]|nr:WXG100 family type VII secretion target [Lachnospiraceae bacterium]